ncbi:MAG: FkbM family methyltransferase [Bacteroidetes bacterium]|nr:FkbM family methyltransferase [Bacteroidota bacterium]
MKQQLRRIGLEVNRFNAAGSFTARRQRMLTRSKVDLVIDAGASDGGFAIELRASGYNGRIVSFEPLENPFRSLQAKAKRDHNWEVFQYALGAKEKKIPMHISRDDKCSSLLNPLKRQTRVYSGAETSSSTNVQMHRLKDLYGMQFQKGKYPFLKIDTQGYEGQVLDGVGDLLDAMVGLQIELSLVPLFDGARSYTRLLGELEYRKFLPVMLEPVFIDPETEQTLQVDAVFFRQDLID